MEYITMCIKAMSEYLIKVAVNGGWAARLSNDDRDETNPLNTAEVLCGLIKAKPKLDIKDTKLHKRCDNAINNAIRYLHNTQTISGGWATGTDNLMYGKKAIGNTTSTCFALWALILHYGAGGNESLTEKIVGDATGFLNSCCGSGLYYYSPGLPEEGSIASAAYILLSYSLILSSGKLTDHKLQSEVSQKIYEILKHLKDVIDYDPDDIKAKPFIVILTCYSILLLQKTENLDENKVEPDFLKDRLSEFKDIISRLGSTKCTTLYNETQILYKKRRRNFIHYVPVWMHILNKQLEKDERYYASEVLNAINSRIHDGSVRIEREDSIWATGLTLFALAH